MRCLQTLYNIWALLLYVRKYIESLTCKFSTTKWTNSDKKCYCNFNWYVLIKSFGILWLFAILKSWWHTTRRKKKEILKGVLLAINYFDVLRARRRRTLFGLHPAAATLLWRHIHPNAESDVFHPSIGWAFDQEARRSCLVSSTAAAFIHLIFWVFLFIWLDCGVVARSAT